MSVKIKAKHQFLILLAALAAAFGVCFLLNFILAGPKLGKHYDFLLRFKKPPAVSHEILIINSDEFIENSDIFSMLLTLTEMEAQVLIMTAGLSSLSSPVTVTENEIRRRFFDEYSVIGSNIRNLFEAIRMGYVTPAGAHEYVDTLVRLTENSKDRLLAAFIDRDEDFLLAINVFGNYFEAEGRIKTDKDGRLRRVQPVDTEDFSEHPVFTFLKKRYDFTQIETIEENKYLYLKNTGKNEGGNTLDITLDNNANIIAPYNCDFRKIDISVFYEYWEADRKMRSALIEADLRGIFSGTLPENSPLFLSDYEIMLKNEMLKFPTHENIQNWKNANVDYLNRLDGFLSGHAENLLIKGYEEVIQDETSLSEEGRAALAGMRDGLIQFFIYLKDEYKIFCDARAGLEKEIPLSFCIIGPNNNTLYSALLANSLITGEHIKPVREKYVLLFSITLAFLTLVLVFWMKPVAQIFACTGIVSIFTVLTSCVFIFFSMWIDPIIIFGSSFAGVIVVFSGKQILVCHRTRLFRTAYGSGVSNYVLKELIRTGRPHPKEISVCSAAVVAVKDVNLFKKEDVEKPQDAGKLRKMFFNGVKDSVFKAGGIIAGFEGDTILACFGSPLDKLGNPVSKACSLVKDLTADEKNAWRYGIDTGNCAFYWSHESGYSVHGRPAVRARILASRTVRLKARALITDNVRLKLGLDLARADSIFDNESIFSL